MMPQEAGGVHPIMRALPSVQRVALRHKASFKTSVGGHPRLQLLDPSAPIRRNEMPSESRGCRMIRDLRNEARD